MAPITHAIALKAAQKKFGHMAFARVGYGGICQIGHVHSLAFGTVELVRGEGKTWDAALAKAGCLSEMFTPEPGPTEWPPRGDPA